MDFVVRNATANTFHNKTFETMDPKPFLPDYLVQTPYGISITESINRVTGDGLQPHPLLPSKFNAHDRARTVEVANDGMDVMFGTPRFGNDSDAGSVRPNNPIQDLQHILLRS